MTQHHYSVRATFFFKKKPDSSSVAWDHDPNPFLLSTICNPFFSRFLECNEFIMDNRQYKYSMSTHVLMKHHIYSMAQVEHFNLQGFFFVKITHVLAASLKDES